MTDKFISIDYGSGPELTVTVVCEVTIKRRLEAELPPKPLPATTVLRCACAGCGRRIPQRELIALIAPPKCPECGSILRAWERTPPSLFACFRAWYQLRQWNRRKAKLNRQP